MLRLLPILIALLIVPAGAQAYPTIPQPTPPVADNPADTLAAVPIEDSLYDPARRCTRNARRPGIEKLTAWLQANSRGVFWGTYRCEKWGKGKASLHAEKRAIDWHLDARAKGDQRAANKLFRLLLAPDAAGNPQALARRMGVQELIWDCGYWGAGMPDFGKYSVCYTRRGKLRKKVNVTAAHRDHIHIGMTKDGAMARTSFWR
jgi:hypothetical protein